MKTGLTLGKYLLLLPMLAASPALAFDPDTPVDAPKESFPITLGDEEDTTIALAFRTAFGLPRGADPAATRTIDGNSYSFRPVAIHTMPGDVVALLSIGSLEDAGHSEGGLNAIHYLKASPAGWIKQGEWIGVGATGTVGNGATSWAFSTLLGRNPYLITAGGGVWQGCAVGSAVVTELTPEGPVDRGSFVDGMSSGGGDGQTEQEYEGRISAAVADKSFTVSYTGTRAIRQQYILKNGTYELVGKDQIPGC